MFLIINKNDVPIFEANVGTVKKDNTHHHHQFIIHAALDLVDEESVRTPHMYLKAIDKFNDLWVSAYVLASNIRLMLVHDTRDDEKIRSFFLEVHELLLKAMLNPMFDINQSLSGGFRLKFNNIVKKILV